MHSATSAAESSRPVQWSGIGKATSFVLPTMSLDRHRTSFVTYLITLHHPGYSLCLTIHSQAFVVAMLPVHMQATLRLDVSKLDM